MLIDRIRRCKDGDLEDFKKMCRTGPSEVELAIFAGRNRSFPHVLRCLFEVQLARLAVPQAFREDPAFETLLGSVIARGLCRTGGLREVIKTFRLLKGAGLSGDWAAVIASCSYDPIA